jgi:AcrR family transcriptional regulator
MDGGEGSKRQSTQARRAQIVAAAVECLIQHGYAGLTARKVAAGAGVSLGHLTYHFDTMEAVLIAAYQSAAQQLGDVDGTGQLGMTPAERLEAYLRAVYAPAQLTDARLRLRVDLWSAAQTSAALMQIERDLHAQTREKVNALLMAVSDPWKTGRVPMVEGFVMATMDGLWLDYRRNGDLDATHAAIEACVLFARMRLGGA